jgi:predicted flap endonuclease-1-like 5' DNA nuclease
MTATRRTAGREAIVAKIIEIEGVGEVFAAKLSAAGVETVEALLQQGGTPAGRKAIAEKTGITANDILEWVNRADLMRIKGVGSEFSDLLEQAGVDTVRELATRNPANLHAKMEQVNADKELVRRLPTAAEVEKWVAEAKTLPVAVTY